MKKILILIFLFLINSFVFSNNKPVIAVSNNWAPYFDLTDGTAKGLSVDIITEALKSQGYDLEIKVIPWARALKGVIDAQYDILPDAWYTKERAKNLNFSNHYFVNRIKVISRIDDTFVFEDIKSLSKKRIGVIRDYSYSQEFNDFTEVLKVPTNSLEQSLRLLLEKKVDGILADEKVFLDLIKDRPEIITSIKISKNDLDQSKLFVACGFKNKRNKEIIQAFNKGLEEIKKNGIYDSILEKYSIDKYLNN